VALLPYSGLLSNLVNLLVVAVSVIVTAAFWRYVKVCRTTAAAVKPLIEAMSDIPSGTLLLCRDEGLLLTVRYSRFLWGHGVQIIAVDEDGVADLGGESELVFSESYALVFRESPMTRMIDAVRVQDGQGKFVEFKSSLMNRVKAVWFSHKTNAGVLNATEVAELARKLRTGKRVGVVDF
jgi:hypothetical protein